MSHDSKSSSGRRPAKRNTLDLDEIGSVQLDNLSDISDGSDLQFSRGGANRNGANYRRDDSSQDSSRSSRSSRSETSYRSRGSGRKEASSYELKLDMLANQAKRNVPTGDRRGEDVDPDEVKGILDGASSDSDRSRGTRRSSRRSDDSRSIEKRKSYNGNPDERRQFLLGEFDKFARKGIRMERTYNMRSSLDEMEQTYARIKSDREIQASINFQRRILIGIVSGLEYLNKTFDPFDLELDGWGESVFENIREYDDIFEELHEKYKHRGNVSPEVRLLMTLVSSAVMFHLTKSMIRPIQERMAQALGGGNGGGAGGMPDMSAFMNAFMGGGAPAPRSGPSVPPSGGMRGPSGFDDLSGDSARDVSEISDIPDISEDNRRPAGRSGGVPAKAGGAGGLGGLMSMFR